MSSDPGFNTDDTYFKDYDGYGVFAVPGDATASVVADNTVLYGTWKWKQIEAAIMGGSDLATPAAQAAALSQADYTTLWDAGNAFEYVMQVLRAVGENLLIQANLLAGYDTSPWQGDAASAFLTAVTHFSRQVTANADVLAGGSAGLYQSVPQQLVDSGNALAKAQATIKAIDYYYADLALKWGAPVDSSGLVLISHTRVADQLEQNMADDMRNHGLFPLVKNYKIAIAAVQAPPVPVPLTTSGAGDPNANGNSLPALPGQVIDPNAPAAPVADPNGVIPPLTGLPATVSNLLAPAGPVADPNGVIPPLTGQPATVSNLLAPAGPVADPNGVIPPLTGLSATVADPNAPAGPVADPNRVIPPLTGLSATVADPNAPAAPVADPNGVTPLVTALPTPLAGLNTATAPVASVTAPVAGLDGANAPLAGINRVAAPGTGTLAGAGRSSAGNAPPVVPFSNRVLNSPVAAAVNPNLVSPVDSTSPAAAQVSSAAADAMPMMPMMPMGGMGAGGGTPGLERSDASALLGETRAWSPDAAAAPADEAGSELGAVAGGLGLAGLGALMAGRMGAGRRSPGPERSAASGLLSEQSQAWHAEHSRADAEPAPGTAPDGPGPAGTVAKLPRPAATDEPGPPPPADDTSAWGPASAAAAFLLSGPGGPSRPGDGLIAQEATRPGEAAGLEPAEPPSHPDLATWQRTPTGTGPGSIVGASAHEPELRCSSAASPGGAPAAVAVSPGEDAPEDEDEAEAGRGAADLLTQEPALWGGTWEGDPGAL